MVRSSLKACGVRVLEFITIRDMKLVIFFDDWREVLYEIAIWGFTSAGLEEFIHLCLATQGIFEPAGFTTGLLAVIVVPNGLGIALALNNWTAIRFRRQLFNDKQWPGEKACSFCWWRFASSPWLAPLEIATGFSFFFLFGAGFFLAPSAIMLAGCLRFTELRHSKYVQFVTTGYKREEKKPVIDPRADVGVVADRQSLMPGIYIGA